MRLLYKQDWEAAKERMESWWKGEYFGRCALAVTAPGKGRTGEEPPAPPRSTEDRWLSMDYLDQLNDYKLKRTYYGGEAVPVWSLGSTGWADIPAFLGANIVFREETVWQESLLKEGCLTDYDYRGLAIKNNKWFALCKSMHRHAAEVSIGKSFPLINVPRGSGDVLSVLRGTENFLMDMMDCPEYIGEFDRHIARLWIEVFNMFYDIAAAGHEGCVGRLGIWAPGKTAMVQNDFSYMISPKMFRDIFLASIEMKINSLDYPTYHADGEMAFAHVDALCEIRKLKVIQILPGAGKPSPLHYMDTLKKVQAAGKNLHITIPAKEVRMALDELSAAGLFIQTTCASEEDATDLIRNAEKWSKVRR